MTPEQFADSTAGPSCLHAIEAGRGAEWHADFWLANGLAETYAVRRPWLVKLWTRIDDVMCGERTAWEDGLKDVMKWLSREARRGPYQEAAYFFLVHVVAGMRRTAEHEQVVQGLLPESRGARAFGAALAFIRLARDQARGAGQEPPCVNLQDVAEVVSRDILRGEGISVTDVLIAIQEHTAAAPLAEWLGDATTKH
jgi:hypothetical protein